MHIRHLKVTGMSSEVWKQILDWFAVVLVGLTFVTGAAALVVGPSSHSPRYDR